LGKADPARLVFQHAGRPGVERALIDVGKPVPFARQRSGRRQPDQPTAQAARRRRRSGSAGRILDGCGCWIYAAARINTGFSQAVHHRNARRFAAIAGP